MNEYTKQAKEFMKKTGVQIDMQQIRPNLAFRPLWATDGKVQHGLEYRVSIYKIDGSADYRFTFWDSIHNAETNKRPTVYDILASLNPTHATSFDEFCDEYGYDRDSIKALETWKEVEEESKALHKLFTEKELDMLAEIQ